MPLVFPTAPTLGQIYEFSGRSWRFNGVGWAVYSGLAPLGPRLPAVTGLNSTFNEEGDSTSGWTATDMSMAISNSVLRATKTNAAGAGAQISKPATLPANAKDYILYVRMRANTGCICWVINAAGDKLAGLWLNSSDLGSQATGTLSLTGYRSDGTRTGAVVATGVDTVQNWVDAALHFDSKFNTLSAYLRRANGTWDFRARVLCDHNNPVTATFRTLSTSETGAWVEFDFLTVARPNLVVVGDSIAEGKNGFSPNPSLNLTDYSNTWFNHCTAYAALRNSLFVGKGVGSETSAATLARATDYTTLGAQAMFLHASTNDVPASVSLAQRTTNIQSTINAGVSGGAKVALLNSMYGTATNEFNPTVRDYRQTWWTSNRPTLTGLDIAVDIMEPIRDGNNYMQASLTATDGIHPLPAGAKLIGEYTATFK